MERAISAALKSQVASNSQALACDAPVGTTYDAVPADAEEKISMALQVVLPKIQSQPEDMNAAKRL